MSRLRQVSKAEATPEVAQMYERLFGDRDPVKEPGTATGTPGDWWTTFALVPDIFNSAVQQFGMFSSKKRKLDPQLRELGLLRAGFAAGSKFVFSQHCKAARAAGVDEQKIAGIPSWGSSDAYTALERTVLAYTDDLVLADGRVSEATFDRLKASLSDEEILELSYVVCTYRLHATLTRAFRIEYDDVDERIVEVPAPGEAGSANILQQISRGNVE